MIIIIMLINANDNHKIHNDNDNLILDHLFQRTQGFIGFSDLQIFIAAVLNLFVF